MPPPAVRTRSVTTVALPPHASACGGCRRVPLSPFDAYWVALPPVRRVFLFQTPSPPPPPAVQVPFFEVVRALRDSLEAVLPAFYPFAGALIYSPEERSVSIVVPSEGDGGCGVAFVEAETDLDIGRLVDEGEEHDEDALRQLVPDIRRDELPAPVMAAQVTEFVAGSGGVAVGAAVHHVATDGRGLWRFLEMWSAAAAAAAAGVRELLPLPPPLHDRTLVRFDGDGELVQLFLRQRAPDLPKIVHAPLRRGRLSRRTFTFAAPAVKLLKQRASAASADGNCRTPSTFAAMAAHGWVSITRANGLTEDGGGPVFAVFLADVRALMSPPAPGAYAGNCVALCAASLGALELAGSDAHARAFAAVRDAVDMVRRDPLGGLVAQRHDMFAHIPPGRAVILVGSPWFPAYAVEFGFGRTAARVELASMNHDGEMVLVAGREAGSVQVSVAMSADKMPAFREKFVVG